jgi:hypothetical protein
VQPVTPVFLQEVKCQRTAPFWVHPSLQLLLNGTSAHNTTAEVIDSQVGCVDTMADKFPESEDKDKDDIVDIQSDNNRGTFVKAMNENIDVIIKFAKGLKYQQQFHDQCMLQTLEREGVWFL